MRSARQALTDIAALCDDWATFAPGWVKSTRAVLADVEPESAVVWNLGALIEVLEDEFGMENPDGINQMVDTILALLQPVSGVVLTREEAALVIFSLRQLDTTGAVTARSDEVATGRRAVALADRLDEASG